MKGSRAVLAAATFLIGCATGGAASHYMETASAQQGRAPAGGPRWAYYCFEQGHVDAITEQANKVGREGWEMTSGALASSDAMGAPIWCFKRAY